MISILVTGGAGYIGSHTAKVLARSGYRPVSFDNLSTGRAEAVRYGPLIEADLADEQAIRRALREYDIQCVMHFAASAYVGESIENPRKCFTNNVANGLNLLNAMIDEGVRSLVFSSSCATYGIPETVPISESTPQRPINPYGESKLFFERSLNWYGEAYGLRWCTLRYFNAAGADPDGELGEVHDPETHLIPLVVQAGLGSRRCVSVYGTDYDTPDGTAIRDYVHVTDLAQAHLAALDYLKREGASTAMNLGTGRGHSVREVISGVERVGKVTVPIDHCARRPGDPAVLVADASRAKHLLAWKPRYSSLDQIVETAWKWASR
jgi:UDP-glucose-4-epimerase GalE